MIILTQNGEIVNFDNITSITSFSGQIEDEQVFCLLALSPDIDNDISDDDICNKAIQLAVYSTIEECEQASQEIIKCIAENARICQIPDPIIIDNIDNKTVIQGNNNTVINQKNG